MKHLVIPDAHAKPECNKERFRWLGELILEERPDKVICLGDFADMHSLCSYDRGTKGYSARRYMDDINAAIEAQVVMFQPIESYNRKQRMMKKKQWFPEFHMLYGNHDARINRAIDLDETMLDGLISLDDLQYGNFGWYTYPFLDVVVLDGIAYSHYFVSGVMGRAIGGENPAASMLNKHHMSCTSGHTHTFDVARRTRADGAVIRGLVAGCYFEHHEKYAGPANDLWWRGVFIKDNVKDGDYELREISLQTLREKYS